MRLSTQVWAFIVLVAAILGMALYVNSIDIDTSVSTVEETLLPQEFTSDALTTVVGFSFRYPRGWDASASPEDVILLEGVTENDEPGTFAFTFQKSEEPITAPGDLFPEEANAELLAENPLPAARTVVTTDEGLSVREIVVLTENDYVEITSQGALSEATWAALRPTLDSVVRSISAEDFRILENAFAFELPNDNWMIQTHNQFFFDVSTPTDSEQPESRVQVAVFPRERMLTTLTQLLSLNPPPTPEDDPVAIMQNIEEGSTLPLGTAGAPEDAEYFGLEGTEVTLDAGELGEISVAMLAADEDYFVIVLVQIGAGDNQETQAEEAAALLDSVTYTTPDAALFAQQ